MACGAGFHPRAWPGSLGKAGQGRQVRTGHPCRLPTAYVDLDLRYVVPHRCVHNVQTACSGHHTCMHAYTRSNSLSA